jgi:hypothetical protein
MSATFFGWLFYDFRLVQDSDIGLLYSAGSGTDTESCGEYYFYCKRFNMLPGNMLVIFQTAGVLAALAYLNHLSVLMSQLFKMAGNPFVVCLPPFRSLKSIGYST